MAPNVAARRNMRVSSGISTGCDVRGEKLNVAVLMGGPSSEHEVSLATGDFVLKHLDPNRYEIKPIILAKETSLQVQKSKVESLLDLGLLDLRLLTESDVVFIAMHGEFGEDGRLQGLLEFLEIPYTGSGVLASSLAMNKIKSLELFRLHGLLVPPYTHFTRWEWAESSQLVLDFITQALEAPWVVKPADRGSSVGVSIAHSEDALIFGINQAFEHSDHAIVQRYIHGHEVTCAILHDDPRGEPQALPPTQIVPKTKDFFDYFSKYTRGATEEITPPHLPSQIISRIQATALKAHNILGCYGMSRTDMIVKSETADSPIYVLETNTIPGMTQTSLYPQAARAFGLEFSELLDRLIVAALRRHELRAVRPQRQKESRLLCSHP